MLKVFSDYFYWLLNDWLMPWYHKPFLFTIINAQNGLGSFFPFLKSDSKI